MAVPWTSVMLAQTVSVGTVGQFVGGNIPVAGIETRLSVFSANLDGQLTSATFGWSASPCPASVKLKIFRPSVVPFRWDSPPPSFDFVSERGPFDVTAPLTVMVVPPFTLAVQTVSLDPPIPVQAGDMIAITNLTVCGGPVSTGNFPIGFRPFPGDTFSLPGDVTSSFATPPFEHGHVYVVASGPSPALGLGTNGYPCLFGDDSSFCGLQRFAITLEATNPRSGVTASGLPNFRSPGAGYFGLPAFTGDPSFPEVTVKIVDATKSPALGGNFWFFYAPLTDLPYTLTVKDQWRGTSRIYSSGTGDPGQLCGGVDTSAFPGP